MVPGKHRCKTLKLFSLSPSRSRVKPLEATTLKDQELSYALQDRLSVSVSAVWGGGLVRNATAALEVIQLIQCPQGSIRVEKGECGDRKTGRSKREVISFVFLGSPLVRVFFSPQM